MSKEKYLGLFLVLPALSWLVFINLFPFVQTLRLSFYQWVLTKPWERKFVGLNNYIKIFLDPLFLDSLKITAIYVGCVLSAELILGLYIAVLLNRPIFGRGLFLTLLLLPMVISPVVVGLFFRCMTSPDFGLLNYYLQKLGLYQLVLSEGMMGRASTALLTVILMDIWEWTPFVFLLFLAGLRGLPNEPFEAAELDGASRWQRFKYITLPLLKPVILVVVLFRTMDAYRVFDTIWLIGKGGPGHATSTLSVHIYRTAFYYWDIGTSTAMSYIMLIIAIIFSVILLKYLYETVRF